MYSVTDITRLCQFLKGDLFFRFCYMRHIVGAKNFDRNKFQKKKMNLLGWASISLSTAYGGTNG